MKISASSPAFFSRKLLILSTAGFLGLYLIWLLTVPPDSPRSFWIGAITLTFTILLTLWQANKARLQPEHSRSWKWLFYGLCIWSFVDILRIVLSMPALRSYHSIVEIPVTLLYLVGAGCLAPGIFHLPRGGLRRTGRRLPLWMDTIITTLAFITIFWMGIYEPLFRDHSISWIAFLPLGDLLLLLLLVNLFLVSQIETLFSIYSWFGVGILIFTISDLYFSFRLMQGVYSPGSPMDLGRAAGELFFAAAAYSSLHFRYFDSGLSGEFGKRGLRQIQNLLPLISVILLGWFSLWNWQFNGSLNILSLWITILLALAIIARQGILTGEVEMQQYTSLVESIAEPAFVCDQQGKISMINPAFLDALGMDTENDLLRRPLEDFFTPAETVQRAVLVCLRGKPVPARGDTRPLADLSAGWSGEVQISRRDGITVPVFLSLRPIQPGVNRVRTLALAGSAHDLSQQKRQQAALQSAYNQIAADKNELSNLNFHLEEMVEEKTAHLSEAYRQLEQQNIALQQLDQLKSDFVSLVSHELRAPLTNIRGGLELLQISSPGLTPRSRDTLHLVQAELQRLSRFVETILDLSALDAGRLPLYPAPLDLRQIQNTLTRQMQHLPGSQRIHWDLPESLPSILADDQALTSVLFHLIDNALKYAPEGEILLQADTDTEQICIRIYDQGPGIPPEVLAMIFEPFYRHAGQDNQTVYGHGLGLYIVRRLTEAMNGKVEAGNRPALSNGCSGGAVFSIYLPLSIPHFREETL